MQLTGTFGVRTADARDVPKIVALLNTAFAMERAFIDRERTSDPEIAQLLQTGSFLVVDGAADALAACVYIEPRGRRLYLGMLAVDPALQGRGVGRRVITAVENRATELGCSAIDIKIIDRRVELPPLYRALGFKDNGTASFDDPLLTQPCHFLLMSKELTMKRHSVAILMFDDVEVLDFAGPFEVFSRARLVPGADSRRSDDSAPFDVFTVARTRDVVTAIGGLKIVPDFAWTHAPLIDILVVPGGFGTRALLDDEPTIDWIREAAASAAQVTSVCTGALLLARAGLLKNRRATTHWAGLDLLASIDPTIKIERDLRVVSDVVVTSAGVSAGIDMAFSVVERLCGRAVADETAHYIEYPRAVSAI